MLDVLGWGTLVTQKIKSEEKCQAARRSHESIDSALLGSRDATTRALASPATNTDYRDILEMLFAVYGT